MILDRILITHNDFDGITCAVLFAAMGGQREFHIENYETVDARILQVIQEHPEAMLYITDISPKENHELLKAMEEHKNDIVLLDHHKTAEWLNQYNWATINQSECGASMLYQWLIRYLNHPPWLNDFAKLVWHAQDYDLWKHGSSHSKTLNQLLTVYGHSRFIERFAFNPDVALSKTELLLLEIEKEKEEKYINSVMERMQWSTDNLGRDYTLCFAENYLSQIGHRALEECPDCQYAVMVNFKHGIVSLRSRPGVDVSEIAKAHGGGGHAQAAGYPMPDLLYSTIDEFLR